MKCQRCGRELSSNAKFCPICGLENKPVFTEELILAAKNRDQRAMTCLYNETYNYVYQTIKAIIRAEEDTVLDLVQDTYVRAFQYLDQLDKAENFRPWIKRIGANTAKNYLKKKKPVLFSEFETEDDEPQEYLLRDECPEHMPEAVLDQKETGRLIGEILDTLSEDQRLVINLFYFQEMSVREIAYELGCSENTIKSRLNYGRKKVESKVRELEKKGTKLYGLAPLPFLLFLFRAQEASAATLPNAQILYSVQSKIAGAAANGAYTYSGAAGTVANGAYAPSGAAGEAAPEQSDEGLWSQVEEAVEAKNDAENERNAAAETDSDIAKLDDSKTEVDAVVNDRSIYDEILADFRRRVENQEGPSDGRGNSYAYYDLNADGQEEFIIADIYWEDGRYFHMNTICGIYTVIDQEPVQVIEGWSRNTYQIFADNYILNIGSNGADSTITSVFRLNRSGEIEVADISPDSLGEEAQVEYIQLQTEDRMEDTIAAEEANGGSVTEPGTNSRSFEEILDVISRVSAMSIEGYEGSPEHYEEEYSFLGEGVLWILVHREQGAYTLGIFYREYDIDQDGEDELLVGTGVSPSRVDPFVIYNLGEEPIVGEALSGYSFPDDGYEDTPAWNYLEPLIY